MGKSEEKTSVIGKIENLDSEYDIGRKLLLEKDLNDVIESLVTAGYSPSNQLSCYLLSQNVSYITQTKDARKKIAKYEVFEVLLFLIEYYLNRNK